MADNTRLNVGTDGDLYRSIDRTGTAPKVQVVTLDLNPGGSETLMAGAMPVSGTFWPATQPVSLAAAIAATQSGTWSVRSLDGAGNALTSAARGGERALSVQVVDASGNQVTSFGGGGGGTVTANAGTDLNTSLLALEAGGNLATIAGRTPSLGQALAAASTPVVLTAAQLTTLTPLSTVAVTGTFFQATQPVSGTFWQSTQPISGTVTANAGTGTMAVSGTFWQATQPVSGTVTANAGTGTFAISAAALPLPSGAATAVKQPALGIAGTASADVITVQGIASMTALKVDGSGVTQPVSGTFWQATQPVSLAGAVTVAQATAASLNATVVGTGTFAVQAAQSGTWTVTGAGGTFPATQSGTWNVATVTTVTTVAAVTAITNALPAGTNLLGQISASPETGTVYNGTTALTPKFATFTTSSSGATTVVPLVGGKRIRVLRWRVASNGTTNVKWQSHVTPTDISGLSYLTQFKDAGGGYCPVGHFQTVSGEALDINNSLAIAISGEITYVEV